MSEDVFRKADALMRRGAPAADSKPLAPPMEDLPVLTDVVTLDDPDQVGPPSTLIPATALPPIVSGRPDATPPGAHAKRAPPPLTPEIARAVENWLAANLPHLITRRLNRVAERVAKEVGASLRESLPLLIADLLRASQEAARQDKEKP